MRPSKILFPVLRNNEHLFLGRKPVEKEYLGVFG
jgi:hypothetical protein